MSENETGSTTKTDREPTVVAFFAQSRVPAVLTMTDPASRITLVDERGQPVTLTLRVPSDPAVVRARAYHYAVTMMYRRDVLSDDGKTLRPGITADTIADMAAERDRALRAYAQACVSGWSVGGMVTPETVGRMLDAHPWSADLIEAAMDETDRFFPESRPIAANGLAVSFDAVK